MPIRHTIWKIGTKPTSLSEIALGKESLLEQMIIDEPEILSERWLLIGRQVRTSHSGIIDLLALNQDGQIIIIELKRDRTPRDVIAQALDYASWIQKLESHKVAEIYHEFSGGKALNEAFQQRFGRELDEEELNNSHQIVIVASSLDSSTERVANYLNGLGVAINVIFFQVFQDSDNKYLSRSWLIDPVDTEVNAIGRSEGLKGEWNKEYYVSFGSSESRDWEEARMYGFICGGGDRWYSKTLEMLSPGDRVWINVPRKGYVGVGIVKGKSTRSIDFKINDLPALDVLKEANYHRDDADNEEKSEFFVPVTWQATRSLEEAISEVGFFGNQNTVCRPRTSKWDHTVNRLKQKFGIKE